MDIVDLGTALGQINPYVWFNPLEGIRNVPKQYPYMKFLYVKGQYFIFIIKFKVIFYLKLRVLSLHDTIT